MKYSIYFAILFLASCASLEEMHQKIMHRIPTFLSNGIFVSVSTGHDTNSGTNRLEPVKNVQTGISNAVKLGITNIYIARGVYTPGNGLNAATYGVTITNNDISIYGGCDENFTTARSGYSEWDCQHLFGPVVFVLSCTNLTIDKVIVRNGVANSQGSGLYIYGVSNLIIQNSIISNNTNISLTGSSGGFYIYNSQIVISKCVVTLNRAWAGGILAIGTEYQIEKCSINNNYAYSNGGALNSAANSRGTIIDCNIYNNSAYMGGAVLISGNFHTYFYNNLISNNYAGSIYNTSIIASTHFNTTNMIISNCTFIGAISSNHTAVHEVGQFSYTNHTILDNIFATNTLAFLYYDYLGSNIISNENWTNINITNYTGAAVASGNRVTNM